MDDEVIQTFESWINKHETEIQGLANTIKNINDTNIKSGIEIMRGNEYVIAHLNFINEDVNTKIKQEIDKGFINFEQRLATSIELVKKEFVKDESISSSSSPLNEEDLKDLEEYNKDVVKKMIAINNKKMNKKFMKNLFISISLNSIVTISIVAIYGIYFK